MRKANEVYWTTSLPREHEALQALDAYCCEWGGLSRAEATRRLLIEWSKLRRGQSTAAWVPTAPSQSMEPGIPERVRRTSGSMNTSSDEKTARNSKQVLDR